MQLAVFVETADAFHTTLVYEHFIFCSSDKLFCCGVRYEFYGIFHGKAKMHM